jgi:hypothetical protein
VHSLPSEDLSPQVLSLSITGCSFSTSRVLFDTSFFSISPSCQGYIGGGALFLRKFSAYIAGSSFADNSALTSPFFGPGNLFNPSFANGGGLLLRGDANTSSNDHLTAIVINCKFTRNAASGTGFAIFLEPGSTLGISLSTLSYNTGVAATVLSQGIITVTSCTFSFNTALFIAIDFFLSCMSGACSASMSSTNFSTQEGASLYNQKLQDVSKSGLQLAASSDGFKDQVCQIASIVVTGNGPYAPFLNIANDSLIIDLRDAKLFCTKLGYIILNAVVSEVSIYIPNSAVNANLGCSSGQLPATSSGIGAVLRLVALSSIGTALYRYPSFESQTNLVPFDKYQLSCLPCPPNTFQGFNTLYLQDFIRQRLQFFNSINVSTLFFCRQCPAGANCSVTSVLQVLPGYYLWNTSNASNFYVSNVSVSMPPGYGARFVFIARAHVQHKSLIKIVAFFLMIVHILIHFCAALSPTLPHPGFIPVGLAAIVRVLPRFVIVAIERPHAH